MLVVSSNITLNDCSVSATDSSRKLAPGAHAMVANARNLVLVGSRLRGGSGGADDIVGGSFDQGGTCYSGGDGGNGLLMTSGSLRLLDVLSIPGSGDPGINCGSSGFDVF